MSTLKINRYLNYNIKMYAYTEKKYGIKKLWDLPA